MKKIIFVLMLMLIAGNLTAQGLTKYGELTNTSTNFVDKNGKIGITPALNKSGAVATAASIASVTIGTQTWTAKNLEVTTYRDGTTIPQVTDATEWAGLTSGAWCYYGNAEGNNATYGKLYNWYAVTDSRGLAPTGWHVAGDDDWSTLATYLGGVDVAGNKLKEAGTSHWQPTNTGATNESGFTALPGGFRNQSGSFYGIGSYGYWWSITTGGVAYDRELHYGSSILKQFLLNQKYGFSVRCVKD